MPTNKQLKDYARLIIERGIHPVQGQTVVIRVPVEHYAFGRLLQETAYRSGAGHVIMEYQDAFEEAINSRYAEEGRLSEVRPSEISKLLETQAQHAAYLSIVSPDPSVMKGTDEEKIGRIRAARRKAMKATREYSQKSLGQWCVAALPNAAWAHQVFPELKKDEEAVEALYEAIFHTIYMDQRGDVVKNWTAHEASIRTHCDLLNQLQLKKLHFYNSLGTDLFVPLIKDHIWSGGSETASLNHRSFSPNLPTEEVFTTPDCRKTEGKVVASRPLVVGGQIVEGFSFEFHKGKVVSWKAKKGRKTLESLLGTDAGSMRLGEVALVPYSGSVSQLNRLFYNTLFDENAACHLALGASYPTCLSGGELMSEAELKRAGSNVSAIHEDFMFGTADLSVDGIDENGDVIAIFREGNFVI